MHQRKKADAKVSSPCFKSQLTPPALIRLPSLPLPKASARLDRGRVSLGWKRGCGDGTTVNQRILRAEARLRKVRFRLVRYATSTPNGEGGAANTRAAFEVWEEPGLCTLTYTRYGSA
jgi:hypothetical protein